MLEDFRRCSLLACRLRTGRTHQIRTHLSHLGHPLLGDQVYGRSGSSQKLPPDLRALIAALPGQVLHARTLGFRHPRTDESLTLSAPPPRPLQAFLDWLREHAEQTWGNP